MKNPFLNKFVIVRAEGAGVFFGKLLAKEGQEVLLGDARKLHYWKGAGAVEEIAMIGTKRPEYCRFTVTVPQIGIENVLQILPATNESIEAINSVREWKA